jgi:fructose/tagatose bisphosphate aldolase
LRQHEYEAQLTDVRQAASFVAHTGVDALAVCIGNTHSPMRREPQLDYIRLNALRREVAVPLVLHGAAGLAPQTLRHCVELGISKIDVDVELREAYVGAVRAQLGGRQAELGNLLYAATSAVRGVVAEKLRLFGSVGKA